MKPAAAKGATGLRLRLGLTALLVACLLLAAPLSGCSFIRLILEPLPPAPTLPSESTGTGKTPATGATTAVPTIAAAAPTTTDKPTVVTQAPSGSTPSTGGTRPGTVTTTDGSATMDAFETRVSELILAGLKGVNREIVLDKALADVLIPASMADATIERVFDLFQKIYYEHPEFYFLSGQANASYALQHGTTSTLTALTLKPGFIDSTAGLSTAAIQQRQTKLLQKAATLAAAAKAASTDPVRQLLAIHDDLVHLIRYDEAALKNEALNRERSNAASGLLDGLALCQGYAASFQLVAQQLGFEVRMPTGTAEGINHAWNLVRLGQAWYHVDVTYDDPTPDGGANAPVDHVHFLRSDTRMRETHSWTAAKFPAAKDDSAAYYRLNNFVSGSRSDLQKHLNTFVDALPDPLKSPRQFEMLYTGSDLPTLSDLEKMLSTALGKAGHSGRITYRRRVDKKVVLLEILPE